jgi:hypothetical protein
MGDTIIMHTRAKSVMHTFAKTDVGVYVMQNPRDGMNLVRLTYD